MKNNFTFKLNINNMEFDILELKSNRHDYSPTTVYFEKDMIALTSNENYMKLNNWIESVSLKKYKIDLNYNGIKIKGIFPIEFYYNTFDQYIRVIFSIDHIDGDIELFKLQQLRKQKLEKIVKNIYNK